MLVRWRMAGTHERQVAVPSNSPQPSAGNARVDFRRVAASAGLSAPKYIDPKNATSDGPLGFCRRTAPSSARACSGLTTTRRFTPSPSSAPSTRELSGVLDEQPAFHGVLGQVHEDPALTLHGGRCGSGPVDTRRRLRRRGPATPAPLGSRTPASGPCAAGGSATRPHTSTAAIASRRPGGQIRW